MSRSFRLRCSLIVLFSIIASCIVLGQTGMANVVFKVYPECGIKNDPRLTIEDLDISFFLDSKPVRKTGGSFAEGAHYLRVEVKPGDGYKGVPYYISRVEWMKCTGTTPLLTENPKTKEANFIVNIDKSQGNCYKAVVYIDRCAGEKEEAREAKIKFITTASNKDTKQEFPTDKIAITIADQPVTFDNNGIGFIKVPAGKYNIKYDWKGGTVSYPGPASIRNTKNNQTQALKTVSDKFEFFHQITLDLKEFAGTENLYDFEVRLNMSYVPKGAINEVRVVAVMPDVQCHKAGSPEDNWIPVTKDMVLQEGDEISCDPDGMATLQFADNSTTVVKNTTQLKIASYFTEGGVVKTEILLKMGEVAAKVHKSEATKSDFRIKTPTGDAAVRGTIFSIHHDPGTKTNTIKVEEGLVEVSSANTSIPKQLVRAGEQLESSMSSTGKKTAFHGQIDFTTKEKVDISVSADNINGRWLITQGNYKGILTINQNGTSLTGEIAWDNHQKGSIASGTIVMGLVMFEITYPGDLIGYYNAKISEDRKKMVEGKGLSNKGTESVWSAVRQ